MIKIEVKRINLNRSRILQMENLGIPKERDLEVLGWVNIGKDWWVIIKLGDRYYRAEYISKIETSRENIQVSLRDGGYEYPELLVISVEIFNRSWNYRDSPDQDDNKNVRLYQWLSSYKQRVDIAGQLYY